MLTVADWIDAQKLKDFGSIEVFDEIALRVHLRRPEHHTCDEQRASDSEEAAMKHPFPT